MRKITLISLALVTVLGSVATPSFAQVATHTASVGGGGSTGGGGGSTGGGDRTSRGSDNSGGGGQHEGRGNYANVPPVKHKKPVVIAGKGGAYCSTNFRVLFDSNGRRTKVRHCDERNRIEIN